MKQFQNKINIRLKHLYLEHKTRTYLINQLFKRLNHFLRKSGTVSGVTRHVYERLN